MEEGKIVSIEDRIPKLKQLRKRKADRRLILLLSLFFLLIACVMYFLSPLSHIRSIHVEGNRYISAEQVIALSGLTKDTSIWKIDKKKSEAKVKTNSEIKEADIKTRIPNSVIITVNEENRIAYVAREDRFLPILENGEILKPLRKEEIPVYAPVLIGFSEGKKLNQLLGELEKLPQEILNSISEIHAAPAKTDIYHITLYMNDGFEVSATSRTLSEDLVHYPSIISKLDPDVKGVIDFEVGAFFKPYDPPKTEKDKEAEKNFPAQ
ncbi:FtsQ-type POTRA domain-containing protein [Peribacillus cavernae]|uniref:Cell division protein DivIB n=1 Tax=Peribacillus cavernae TaxID=1674310 RepID=A0A433HPX6_9BACI|nr:FtsQ-type POTRA domain-containing protein [Peribacillus cavernae]MDQ0217169.1 cell division protein FtsQ [Peribacillus cavernae]RUQ30357.1 FtsQ-type POTRA domain-containing protein [Peribacillus cavernae]